MHDHIIVTRDLTRRFEHVLAVNGLNLDVPVGSVYGFLGPNGAGKTTTIRMILGLVRPSRGRIELFGRPAKGALQELLGQIGVLVETPSYYPHLTGQENLQLVARLRQLPNSAVQQALAMVDLEKDGRRLVKHYSLGMIQRLGLAMALLGDPQLLILDEPTNGLDPAGMHEMRTLIRQLPAQYGITVLVSSHLLNEVEQVATHIGIIQHGSLVFQGHSDDLRSRFCETVRLTTDRPPQAQQLLGQLGWQVKAPCDHTLQVKANGAADVAVLVTQLVQAGLKIYHASLEKPSLEDIFLQLTHSEPTGG